MGLSQNSSFGSGNYLSQKDVAEPVIATVKDVRMETLKNDNGEEEKPVCHFKEDVKPLVLNRVNFLSIDEIAGGHDDTDHWVGKQVELYMDPGVMFGAKRVGGVRVRPPRATTNGSARPLLTLEEAVKLAEGAGKTKDDLVAMLKSGGATAYNAKEHSQIVRDWVADVSIPF